jgi:hypothetical protein
MAPTFSSFFLCCKLFSQNWGPIRGEGGGGGGGVGGGLEEVKEKGENVPFL